MGTAGQIVGAVVGGIAGFAIGGPKGAFIGASLGYAIGGLIDPPASKTGDIPPMASYPIQRSNKGTPIPKIYGTVKVAGNILWMGENHPWQKKAKGGGSGGGASQVTDSGNRKSFLPGICEGPADILRIWKGKELIANESATFFRGDGSPDTGINALTDEEFSNYPNMCCAFFDEFEIGAGGSLPNFTFEVRTGRTFTDIFVGSTWSAGKSQALWVIDQVGTVHDPGSPAGDRVTAVHVCPNGDYLVGTDGDELIKYNADGSGDKVLTFATNGVYAVRGTVKCITLDPDGNVIVGSLAPSSEPCIAKLDSEGALLWENLIPSGFFDNEAHGVVTDSVGDIYVAHSVGVPGIGGDLHFTASKLSKVDGSRLVAYNSPDASGNFSTGIAVDDFGFVYISSWRLSASNQLWRNSNDNVSNWGKDWGFGIVSAEGVIVLSGDAAADTKVYMAKLATAPAVGATIYKLNFDLSVVETTFDTEPTDMFDICWAENDEIVTVGFFVAGGKQHVIKLDSDLNEIAQYSVGDNAVQCTTCAVIPAWGVAATDDVNPSDVIYDLLTNTRYGAGKPVSFINLASFNEVAAYCDDNDLRFSFVIDVQRPDVDWINYILSHFQGYLFMSEGKINLGVYKSEDSVFTLTQDNLVVIGDDPPVSVQKRLSSETANRIEVTWRNRAAGYDTSVAIAMDEVDQRVSGKVRKKTVQLTGITTIALAQKVAYRLLRDSLYRFGTYNFMLSYKNMLLEVGDVGTLSDGDLIDSQKIRITSIEEDTDGRGLAIQAVDDPAYMYEDVSYDTQDTDRVEDAAPTLEDASATFTENLTDRGFAISVAPGGEDTNGWFMYKSFDDITYEFVSNIPITGVTNGDANSTGTTTGSLPAHPTGPIYAGAEVLEVDIGTVTDLDTAITDADFFNNKRLCKVGNEIMAYKTCVETDVAGVWTITGLIRGLFGTQAVAHAVGETFWTVTHYFTFEYSDADIGQTLYFKFLTFHGSSVQSIGSVSGIPYTILGNYKRPMPLSLMRIQDREGLLTYETDDVAVAFYFASKTAGFNLGGHGNVLWGAYEPDASIKTLDVTLKELDGTEITNEIFEISDIGEPMALFIPDADRGGNSEYIVEMNPGALYAGIGSREITVEQI